jgi:hypothetical protein
MLFMVVEKFRDQSDLVEFEVVPVVAGKATAQALAAQL